MVSMLFADILDSKVVDNEGKENGAGFVFPKARCMLGGCVSVERKPFG